MLPKGIVSFILNYMRAFQHNFDRLRVFLFWTWIFPKIGSKFSYTLVYLRTLTLNKIQSIVEEHPVETSIISQCTVTSVQPNLHKWYIYYSAEAENFYNFFLIYFFLPFVLKFCVYLVKIHPFHIADTTEKLHGKKWKLVSESHVLRNEENE